MIILGVIGYLLLSIVIGCNKFEKYIRHLNYLLSIPIGDMELYDIKEPKIITPITLLFLPSLVAFLLCEENYYK